MTIDQYLQLFRRYRLSILACVIVGSAVGAAFFFKIDPPDYQAQVQLYGSAGQIAAGQGTAYEAERYTQQRMRSYANLLDGRAGAQAVRERLDLGASVDSIRHDIRVSVPPDSSIATITARGDSPERAKAIADTLGRAAPAIVAPLESPAADERPPIRLRVIGAAQTPTSRVASPFIYLVLGAFLGLVVGICVARLRKRFDDRICEDGDVAGAASVPVLGTIASLTPRLVADDPRAPEAEDYRRLMFHLGMAVEEDRAHGFVITSTHPGEGTSVVVANLGLSLARAGNNVVAVDANLRAPRLASLLGTADGVGLAEVLAGDAIIDATLSRRPGTSLTVLPGGRADRSPAVLLETEAWGSTVSRLVAEFDWVLIDAPAAQGVADALIISGGVSGTLVVADPAMTGKRELRRTCQDLRMAGANPVGVVIHRARPSSRAPERRPPARLRRGGRRKAPLAGA